MQDEFKDTKRYKRLTLLHSNDMHGDFLAEKVDELSLHAVMTIEGKDHRIAETIVENTKNKDQQILTMDSMQSVTSKDVESGASYMSIMENNLSVLKEALK